MTGYICPKCLQHVYGRVCPHCYPDPHHQPLNLPIDRTQRIKKSIQLETEGWQPIQNAPPPLNEDLLWGTHEDPNYLVYGELTPNGQVRSNDSMTFRNMNDFFTHWMYPPKGPKQSGEVDKSV